MRTNNLSILLIEDDVNDVFFFERAMKQAGMEWALCVARDGHEAIGFLSNPSVEGDNQEKLPSLIVLDLNLPNKPGLEVLEWIRTSAPDPTVPVIVLTSSTSDTDMRKAYRLGANSYLNKPSHPEELTELLRVFQLYWFRHNRVPPRCREKQTAMPRASPRDRIDCGLRRLASC
jgi:DNA-binding response OmpR family regulator